MKSMNDSVNIARKLASKRNKPKPVFTDAAGPVPPSPPRMTMTVEEMGKELGVSRATAYELSQRPDFPSFSIGRRVLISRDGLLKWIEKQYSSKNPEHG